MTTVALVPRTPPDANPTSTTIVLVRGRRTRSGMSAVAARLAGLATTDELIVVYEPDERGPQPGVLAEQLRDLLPRYTICTLYLSRPAGSRGSGAAVLDELLEVGGLPIVITGAGSARAVATELSDWVGADRLLSLF